MDTIKCKNIVKAFPGEVTIRYNDIVFERGRSYLILGGSGCGKSTLLNILAGVAEPTEGSVVYELGGNTVELNALSQKERDKFRILNVGYIYQDFKLMEEMSVEDNLDVLRLETKKLKDIDKCLATLGIADKKKTKVKHLSGGQKQRVAIARALVKDSSVLFADEPTGNLNAEVGRQIVKQFAELGRDKFLIVVSHDESLAEYFTDIIRLEDIAESEICKP